MSEAKVEPLSETVPLAPSQYFKNDQWKTCLRKTARAQILNHQPLVYVSYPGLSPKMFKVEVIAELGAGLLTEEVDLRSELRNPRLTRLHFGEIAIPVKSQIVFCSQQGAGLEFIDPSDSTRRAIRTHFLLELLAASLPPIQSYGCVEPGANFTLIYSDGGNNKVELFFKNELFHGYSAVLGTVNAKVRWTRTQPISSNWDMLDDDQNQAYRTLISSFIRNLQGLTPEIQREIEWTFNLLGK